MLLVTEDVACEGDVQGLLAAIVFRESLKEFLLHMAVKCLKEILAHSLAVTLAELLNISRLDVVLLHMRGGKLEYLSAPKGQHILPCLRTDQQTLSLVAYAQTDRYKCKGTESLYSTSPKRVSNLPCTLLCEELSQFLNCVAILA